MSYIKKELLLADILDAKIKNTQEESQRVLSIFERMVQRQPDTDVVEVRHGYWKEASCSEKDGNAHCSECNHWDWSDCKYCSECGAKMDGERKEEE